MDLIGKVKKVIEKENLIDAGDRVLLGVSGGIDSTTLLFVLLQIRKTIPFELGLAHINHGLRGKESDRDEIFVKDLARRFSLPFHIKKINMKEWASRSGLSLQHAGREVRYSFFSNTAKRHHYNKIAIAHTLDDQVETFLLRMIKGTGLRGLSSIPIRRGSIIRPLLLTYRAEIEEYAGKHQVPFVTDSSNEKIIYERNFVRREIIPVMEQLNPAVKEKIFLLLQDLTAINRTFDTQSKIFLSQEKTERDEEILLPIKPLAAMNEETRFRVFSDTLASIAPRFIPLRRHILAIEKIMRSTKPNLTIALPCKLKVKRQYATLIFTQKTSRMPIPDQYPVTMGSNILDAFRISLTISTLKNKPPVKSQNNTIAMFDREKIGSLSVRTFRAGDRFFPLGMRNSVKLKDFFIAQKIPMEGRRLIPLLLSDNDIIWIVGQRIDDRFKVTEKTGKTLKVVAGEL